MTTTTIDIRKDFPWAEKHGVRIFDHEDDWGWTILGTPPSNRIFAAINALTRDLGGNIDLREQTPNGLDDFKIKPRIAINFRRWEEDSDYITWDWSDNFDHQYLGGVLMTVVTLR